MERGKDCGTSAGWSVRGPEEHKSWGLHRGNSAHEGPREHHPPRLPEEHTSGIALGEQAIKITPLSLVNKQLLTSLCLRGTGMKVSQRSFFLKSNPAQSSALVIANTVAKLPWHALADVTH